MHVLAIDGGGSKTAAAVAHCHADGTIVVTGRGSSGGSNPTAIGFEAAIEAVDQAVAAAISSAGLRPATAIAAGVLAMAGSERPQLKRRLSEWADQTPIADRFEVVNDALPLLALATDDATGIAVVAGTGAIAYGRTPDGRAARAGGWGYLIGDDGGGFRIGADAVRAVLRQHEGRGESTELARYFAEELELRTVDDVLAYCYRGGSSRVEIAALAPAVVERAEESDPVARRIVDEATRSLAALVHSVATRLAIADTHFPLVGAGGLLQQSPWFRDQLQNAVAARQLVPGPLTVAANPVEGSLRLAVRLARGDR